MLKRIIGFALIAMGVVVAVHTVIEPLYHVSTENQPYSPIWEILNPLMVLSLVLGLIFAYMRKAKVDAEGGDAALTREFVIANALFYGLLVVGILMLWNWFNLLSPAFTAIGPETVSLVWIVIDASLPFLLGGIGIFLARGGG